MKNISKESMGENKLDAIVRAVFCTMLENTGDMVFVKDKNLRYVAASLPFVKMVGKEKTEEIVGHTDGEIFEDKQLAQRYVADDRKLIRGNQNLINYIEPITEEQGNARYGSTSKYILRDETGECIGILGITKDITRDYHVRQHYQQELKYLFELPEDAYAVSYIDVDDWRIISQRRRRIQSGTLQACNTVEELCRAAVASFVDPKCEAADFYRGFTAKMLRSIYAEGRSSLSFEYQRYLTDSSISWVHNDIRFLTDVDSGHLCVMLSANDISAQKREEEKWIMAAKMDKMTMILNRDTTMDMIRQVLLDNSEKKHALLMLDVDNFKKLNDTLGHQAGDEFLIKLAHTLKDNFRKQDVVGRIGGDEFWVLMRDIESVDQVLQKSRELYDIVMQLCEGYEKISLSGSMGISFYPQDGRKLDELYEKADKALYEAKRNGKAQVVLAHTNKG